ncbi:hypothetical protein B0H13DRAFT_1850851 [Mycena leptocephala]|nr:hypothetical protein B0H13DRAFT_1850851 [Mycena leptocephala]
MFWHRLWRPRDKPSIFLRRLVPTYCILELSWGVTWEHTTHACGSTRRNTWAFKTSRAAAEAKTRPPVTQTNPSAPLTMATTATSTVASAVPSEDSAAPSIPASSVAPLLPSTSSTSSLLPSAIPHKPEQTGGPSTRQDAVVDSPIIRVAGANAYEMLGYEDDDDGSDNEGADGDAEDDEEDGDEDEEGPTDMNEFRRGVRVAAVRRFEANRRAGGRKTQAAMVKAWNVKEFTAKTLKTRRSRTALSMSTPCSSISTSVQSDQSALEKVGKAGSMMDPFTPSAISSRWEAGYQLDIARGMHDGSSWQQIPGLGRHSQEWGTPDMPDIIPGLSPYSRSRIPCSPTLEEIWRIEMLISEEELGHAIGVLLEQHTEDVEAFIRISKYIFQVVLPHASNSRQIYNACESSSLCVFELTK